MGFEITRLEKKEEDGVFKTLIIGITYTNPKNNKTAYMDWEVDKEEIGDLTKENLMTYIKNYLQKKEDNIEMTREEVLKKRTQAPTITFRPIKKELLQENTKFEIKKEQIEK